MTITDMFDYCLEMVTSTQACIVETWRNGEVARVHKAELDSIYASVCNEINAMFGFARIFRDTSSSAFLVMLFMQDANVGDPRSELRSHLPSHGRYTTTCTNHELPAWN